MLVAYTLWGWAIERRGVGRTVPYLYLIPVITGVLALIFLDEAPSTSQLAGTLLVFVGIALARRGSTAGVRAERSAPGAVRGAPSGPAREDERAATRPHPSPGR
jgi:drug/metabolite transporter (DMT)-like permease